MPVWFRAVPARFHRTAVMYTSSRAALDVYEPERLLRADGRPWARGVVSRRRVIRPPAVRIPHGVIKHKSFTVAAAGAANSPNSTDGISMTN